VKFTVRRAIGTDRGGCIGSKEKETKNCGKLSYSAKVPRQSKEITSGQGGVYL